MRLQSPPNAPLDMSPPNAAQATATVAHPEAAATPSDVATLWADLDAFQRLRQAHERAQAEPQPMQSRQRFD